MKTSAANTSKTTRTSRAGKAPRPLRPRGAARVIPEGPARRDADLAAFVSHADGWYWVSVDGKQQFGPFLSLADARADRDSYGDESFEETETTQEAEIEIGISDWIDAETGEPAEGQSPPHLEDH